MTDEIHLPINKVAVISLNSNPSTGFDWIIITNPNLCKIIKKYEPVNTFGLVGSGGITSFTLIPIRTGTDFIHLIYKRPWENEISRDNTMQYKANIYIVTPK